MLVKHLDVACRNYPQRIVEDSEVAKMKWRGAGIVERNLRVQSYEFGRVTAKLGHLASADLTTGNAGRYPTQGAGGRLHDCGCERYRLHDTGQGDSIIDCIHRIEAQLTALDTFTDTYQ